MTTYTNLLPNNATIDQEKNTRANDTERTGQLNLMGNQIDTLSGTNYTFTQSVTGVGTPSATASVETWLELDSGDVYVSTGTGTGNWVYSHTPMIVGSTSGISNGSIGNIINPLVEFDLQNDLNLIRSAGGYGSDTFIRSTVKNYIDRYGVVQQAAIDTAAFEKEGLLLEGASTNLALYSSDLSNAVHTAVKSTKGTSSTVGIDGSTATNDDLTEDGTAGEHYSQQDISVTSGNTITISRFVKLKTGTRNFQLRVLNAADAQTRFNLVTGVVVSSTAESESITALANGWYRVSMTETATSTSTVQVRSQFINESTDSGTYTGDSASAFYLDGFQVEVLPFPSSYIITTSIAVTRTVDLLSIDYAENTPQPADNMTVISDFDMIGVGLPANKVIFDILGEAHRDVFIDSGDHISCRHGTTIPRFETVLSANQFYRAGYVNDGSDLLLYVDGNLKDSDTQETPTGAASGQIQIGASTAGGSSPFYGHVSNFRIYNRALTDSEVRVA